jgi:general stress protein 26
MSDTTTGSADDVRKVAELAKDIRSAMFTTVDQDGEFVARPMAQQEVEFDGDLWFFAKRDSRKVRHITSNPHVGVTLSSRDTWVSINGTAEVVEDRAKARELWNKGVEAWFPEGPEDASIVLIKVNGETAEYWDTPGAGIASALSLVKAKATGKPYDGGDQGRVELDR